jgi:ADP-heptose:LPS heptosyltransferase
MLFGSAAEAGKMDEWTALSDRICNLAGKYRLEEELAVMSRLDIMVAMDSANMHFASLAGTRVVSVWGATHPFSGFYPWQQGYEDAVQIELPCRPCSVFGNKDCYRRDHACMNQLDPGLILNKLAKKT